MMKILGIDYGSKRVGLAVSDETQTWARELAIIPRNKFFKEIKKIIGDNGIGEIVVGLPLNMSGEDTKKTSEARVFKNQLNEISGLAVNFTDERLSSAMTKSLPGGNKNIDSLAAQIILQNYLDQRKAKSAK